MKSIEEKAKAYDEAIERANELYDEHERAIALLIFPELRESEDERIRKGLIAIITDFDSLYLQENYSLSREDALAWLEKQGEQKPAEWSEEVEAAISLLKHIAEEQEKDYCPHNANDLRKTAQYLETCRPKSQWKPSDEQIDALEDAIADAVSSIQKNMLNSLYQDLKKLKE